VDDPGQELCLPGLDQGVEQIFEAGVFVGELVAA
jgi:hypothetical protein